MKRTPLKRTGMPRRKTPLRRSPRLAPRLRSASRVENAKAEWARAYGSKERVAFVQSLPCEVCGARPSENHHVRGGGIGRKADACWIAPLCRAHHNEYHRAGRKTFSERYRVDLERAAARTERLWREHGTL